MKMKCPYCKRPLKIPYDKIKQRVLDENPPSYGPWIAAIVAGIGIAGALGLVGGTVLTKSKEQKAQTQISQLQRDLAKLTTDKQTDAESKQEKDQQTVTAILQEEIEKQTNDRRTAVKTRQQIEPQPIPQRSISSRLDQRDLSNIRTLRPNDPRFSTHRDPRRGLQREPFPNSDSGIMIQNGSNLPSPQDPRRGFLPESTPNSDSGGLIRNGSSLPPPRDIRRRFTPVPAPNSDSNSPKRNESSLPTTQNPHRGSQPVQIPKSNAENPTPDRPVSSVIQKPELITFLPGERASKIQVSNGTNSNGIPQFKPETSQLGFYFHVVESRINTLAWSKEKIEFDKQEGVNIKSTDIVLETTDGQLIHPSFASCGMPVSNGSKEVGFALGPLRNIALVSGYAILSGDQTKTMTYYIARNVPNEESIEMKKDVQFRIDPKAISLYFAFSVPFRSSVRAVGLSKNFGAATDGSQTRSRSQTPPPAEGNRSFETPLGTIDLEKVNVAYPVKSDTITVGKYYELLPKHVLVIVPVIAKEELGPKSISDWFLLSKDGRKCPFVGIWAHDGKTITGVGSMSVSGSPQSPQTNKFLFDVPIGAGPLDLYIGAKKIAQVIGAEIPLIPSMSW